MTKDEIKQLPSIVDACLDDAILDEVRQDLNKKLDKVCKLAIEALEQQPKTGHWIETSEGTVCSECDKYPYDDGEYHIANWSSAFCPNCGAEMEVNNADSD